VSSIGTASTAGKAKHIHQSDQFLRGDRIERGKEIDKREKKRRRKESIGGAGIEENSLM